MKTLTSVHRKCYSLTVVIFIRMLGVSTLMQERLRNYSGQIRYLPYIDKLYDQVTTLTSTKENTN